MRVRGKRGKGGGEGGEGGEKGERRERKGLGQWGEASLRREQTCELNGLSYQPALHH